MKKNLELVILDMAGTTVDEKNVVYKTIQKTLEDNGYAYPLARVLEHCAGKEKRKAIQDILRIESQRNETDEQIDELFRQFKENLKVAYDNLEVTAFEGTPSFFKELKSQNVSIALNTGYDRQTAEGLIQKLNWVEGVDFDILVTADDVDRGRPYPDMIQLAMKKTGVSNSQTVAKVGDSAIDIEEGHSANCKYSIGITTGAQTRDTLKKANPHYIIDQLDEILGLI